jgi:hypothetical protein
MRRREHMQGRENKRSTQQSIGTMPSSMSEEVTYIL